MLGASATSTAISRASGASGRAIPTSPSGSAWVMSPTMAGRYEPFAAPVYLIKGNNDGFDAIADGPLPANLHFLANGRLHEIGGAARRRPRRHVRADAGTRRRRPTFRIRGRARRERPRRPTSAGTSCAKRSSRARRSSGIDVFLTHEAPRPYFVGRPTGAPRNGRRQDADQRGARGDEAAAAPVRPSPPLHRAGCVRACDRSGSTWSRSRIW